MSSRITTVVETYRVSVDGINESIEGRIESLEKDGTTAYKYSLSHYCALSEGAGTYIPSIQEYSSIETARAFLMGYLNSFSNRAVMKNEHF